MATWTKVSKYEAAAHAGFAKQARTKHAVRRPVSTGANPKLIIPGGAPADSADIYSDGNGKLAFRFCENGTYKVRKDGDGGRSAQVSIPARYKDLIPYGTTDVEVSYDGGMTVLDLSQFSAPSLT